MKDYRCYKLDKDGHIVGVELFEAPNDDAAWAHAQALVKAKEWDRYELWHRARKLKTPRN